jgi:phosphoglucomutase
MKIGLCAGKPAEASMRMNALRLITACYTETPDPSVPEQRVAFGISEHRGSGKENS